MELLIILRALRRHPIGIALAALVALAVALKLLGMLPGSSSSPGAGRSGEALVRVLVDTRSSLAASVSADGADTIQRRTVLLAELLQSDPGTAQVARAAGLPPRDVAVLGPSTGVAIVDSQLPVRAQADAASTVGRPDVVSVVVDDSVPIISLGVGAPDPATAARLARAGVSTLTSLAAGQGPGGTGLTVATLGSVRATPVFAQPGRRKIVALVAATIVFVLLSALLLGASALARAWRGAAPPGAQAGSQPG